MGGDWVSFISGWFVVVAACAVCSAYGWVLLPRRSPASWLAHGVNVGFIGVALNAIWWGILLRGSRLIGAPDVEVFVQAWGGYADFLFKTCFVGWAAYAHLHGFWLRLPPLRRAHHSQFLIPFNSRRTALGRSIMKLISARKGDGNGR